MQVIKLMRIKKIDIMKILKNIPAVLFMLAMLSACNADLDKATFDDSTAKMSTLDAIKDSYTFDVQKSDVVVEKFNWSKAELGYDAAVNYSLEMDIAGKNFANKTVLSSSIATTATFKTVELNNAVLALLEKYKLPEGSTQSYEFRIAGTISTATSSLYSNVIKSTITPFIGEREYPKLWVVGDYCGWNHGNAQFLYSENSDTSYTGWVCFGAKAVNGWKLTSVAGWSGTNWGTSETLTEPKTMVLDGGNDIKCFSGYCYQLGFDTTTKQLKVTNKVSSWGLIGDATPGGWSTDTPLVFNQVGNIYEATVALTAGKIKFRADAGWAINFGNGAKAGVLYAGGADISVTTPGTYHVVMNINKVVPTYKLELK